LEKQGSFAALFSDEQLSRHWRLQPKRVKHVPFFCFWMNIQALLAGSYKLCKAGSYRLYFISSLALFFLLPHHPQRRAQGNHCWIDKAHLSASYRRYIVTGSLFLLPHHPQRRAQGNHCWIDKAHLSASYRRYIVTGSLFFLLPHHPHQRAQGSRPQCRRAWRDARARRFGCCP